MSSPKLVTSDSLLVCNTCGAQYDVDESVGKDSCRICDVRFFCTWPLLLLISAVTVSPSS